MEGPVTRIIILAASIAVTALVIGVVWTVVDNNTPDTDPDVSTTYDYAQITERGICARSPAALGPLALRDRVASVSAHDH